MSGHDHSHGHHHHHGSGKVLLWSLVFTTLFAFVEFYGGLSAGSLALLSDAGHMITDSSSLAVGAFAAWLATRPASRNHSFGFQRAEVLGALFNVVFMFAISIAVVVSAIERLQHPESVSGGIVMVIALIGLGINITIAWILMRGERTLNVRGALVHVFGDLLGSVATLVAGIVIVVSGWMPIDPLLSLFVALLILISAGRLLGEIINVLMEGVPRALDAASVGTALTAVPGVRSVHDLHIWSLSSSSYALAAHVDVQRIADWQRILPQLQDVLRERFGIDHSTLQPEDAVVREACDADPDCGV